ncbi:hypothetical protein ABT160_35795 [Streptomyces sp. NPDC001941]|uniref:hypothetical protein n=1 Tax=Streptomyces sp. NPDC001941 TaxID=3154659 RepID=UPI003327BDF6
MTEDDLPDGAHGALVKALEDLHERAAKPSLRKLAELTKAKGRDGEGVSYETIRKMLLGAGLPGWDKWKIVVRHLCLIEGHQDPSAVELHFRDLWRRARAEDPTPGTTHSPHPEPPPPSPVSPPPSPSPPVFSRETALRNARAEELLTALYARAEADAEQIRDAARAEAAATEPRKERPPQPEAPGAPRSAAPHRRLPGFSTHTLAVLGLHAASGLLVGMVIGLLVKGAVLPATSHEQYNGVIGAIAGLFVGTFAGTVIASMGAARVGKLYLIREALGGLAGWGGFAGLFLGVSAGIQEGRVVGVALLTAVEGALFGFALGGIVYVVRFLHPGTEAAPADDVPGPASGPGRDAFTSPLEAHRLD